MKAQANRSRPTFRRLLVEALAMSALFALAAFPGSPSRAQSAPAQQAPPAQPATQQPAPAAQPDPVKSQKNTGSDDDKWPDPEWATQQKQAAAPADNAPQAQTTAAPASNQPAPVPQSAPAPAQHDTTPAPLPATPPTTAATPTLPRPLYTGTNPDEIRKQQVALECSQLLQLATDLKAQVEKSRKDELSVSVVRKAVELEQMARKVRSGTPLSASNVQPPLTEAK